MNVRVWREGSALAGRESDERQHEWDAGKSKKKTDMVGAFQESRNEEGWRAELWKTRSTSFNFSPPVRNIYRCDNAEELLTGLTCLGEGLGSCRISDMETVAQTVYQWVLLEQGAGDAFKTARCILKQMQK